MKKALAGVLAVALAGVIAGSAVAQVPNIQVYFDPAHQLAQTNCPGTPPFSGPPVELYVVMNNWNMNIAGVDFSIDYPAQMVWVADNLPDPDTSVQIGQSPTALGGCAIAYANCCAQDGFQAVEVLRPVILWGQCDCMQAPMGGWPLVVRGYVPLGKTQPSAIRREDSQEFSGVGMTSLICPGIVATEQSTWGQVKALYR
jgi:hypothetical protein